MNYTQPTEPIKRKPVAVSSSDPPAYQVSDVLDEYYHSQHEGDDLAERAGALRLEPRPHLAPRPNTLPLLPTVASTDSITRSETTIPDVPSGSKPFWKTAVDETIHFAGGLVSRPAEINKHFSILRHSSALVYYRGPATSVTITIFSDAPLPPDRSLWLQRKGYSGNAGMNISTLLGTSSNWIDVTPAYEALAVDVPESDERGWQRDIKKFLKKGSKHTARETCVVRIPASASDGYLRLVLCTGESRKKVLCPSPVFRVASTSSDVSIFRGASISTLPLEAGLKVASVVGTTVVNRYAGPARALVDNRVQKYTSKVSKVKPAFIAERAEHIAYAKTGLQNKFNSLEQNFDSARDVSYEPLHAQLLPDAPPEVVGTDSGPQKPFPIKIAGTVVQGTGQSQAQFGFPTANLSGISSDLLSRLNGVYIGWACVEAKKNTEGVPRDWYEALITVGLCPYASPRVVGKNVATVHIIQDFGEATFLGARMKIIIMAYLRPAPMPNRSLQPADFASLVAQDVDVVLASLSRESWRPHRTIEQLNMEKSARSVSDRYVEVRTHIQKGVDSVPLHLVGVRTAGLEMKDKVHGRGGMYIRR